MTDDISVLLLLALSQPVADLDASNTARAPAIVLVITPFGAETSAGRSAVLRILSEVIEEHTDLRARSLEQTGLDEQSFLACPGGERLSCWTKLVEPTKANILFVVSLQGEREGDRIAVSAIDARQAAEVLSSERDAAQAEDLIFERAAHARPTIVDAGDPAKLLEHLEGVVTDELASLLTSVGHWRPFGEISLSVECERCALDIDGSTVGSVARGDVLVRGVRAGPRTLSYRTASAVTIRCTADVVRGERAVARCDEPAPAPSVWPDVLLYGGAAAAALGTVAVAWSIERSASGPDGHCLTRGGETSCDSLGFAGTAYSSGAAPAVGDDALRGGVPLAPIGLGLLTAGGAWLITRWLAGEDVVPWTALIGLGAGTGVFALSFAAGG